MTTEPKDGLTDDGTLLFGAGFVFGVMASLLLLGVVLAVIGANGQSVPVTVGATVVAGVVFASIVGGGLFLLAFPENRTLIRIDAEDFGFGGK
ncbi:hypothetical protein [Halosimplex sp. J119]